MLAYQFAPKTEKAGRDAERALDWFSAFLPLRIANEEIGDALERIQAKVAGPRAS